MTDPRKRDIPKRPTCGATTRQDTDCGRPAGWGTDHPGFGQCKLHGGSTTTGKKHAKQLRQEAWDRILEMTDPALAELRRLVDRAESEDVRLRAVKDILDRAGLGAKHVHEHTGPDGGPIPVEVRAAELLGRARQLRPAPKAIGPRKRSSKGKAAPVVAPAKARTRKAAPRTRKASPPESP